MIMKKIINTKMVYQLINKIRSILIKLQHRITKIKCPNQIKIVVQTKIAGY